uniref:Solute carrier family 19 member 1 n=1 Tax=Labrus bergylta TaxID=56723 RepID=A0A3Q3L832_9LABR
MVDDDAAGSGDNSQEETDLKVPACEDSVRLEDGDVVMDPPPSGDPSEGTTEPRKWKWAVIFLCFYGFMAAVRPGEPFITPYLLSPEKNFTREQVILYCDTILIYKVQSLLICYYPMPNLRLWSLWWIFNSTGYYLVLFYVHILWNKVYATNETKHIYNGAVEAASTLLSAITSFAAGYAKIRWNVWSELTIGIITAVQAALLLLMGTTDNIWICYMAYVLFRGFYQFLVPIATFQIASSLTKELCALVFGINTFLGTILKSVINLIFSDKRGLGLDVQAQFMVYFVYFTILTVVYFVCAAVVITRHFRNQPKEGGGANQQVPTGTPTELCPVATNSEAECLSNGSSAKA